MGRFVGIGLTIGLAAVALAPLPCAADGLTVLPQSQVAAPQVQPVPAPVPVLPAPAPSGIGGAQIAAIGAGIIGGLVVLDGIFGVPPALAAVAGGVVGNWWYVTADPDPASATLTYRQPTHFAIQSAEVPTLRARWLESAPSSVAPAARPVPLRDRL